MLFLGKVTTPEKPVMFGQKHSSPLSISKPIPHWEQAPSVIHYQQTSSESSLSSQRSNSVRVYSNSPQMTIQHKRNPSITNFTKTWLNRNTSSASVPSSSYSSASNKAMRISEPKFAVNNVDVFGRTTGGVLGSGATIVRTPQEALARFDILDITRQAQEHEQEGFSYEDPTFDGSKELPSPPQSPPKPTPLPLASHGRSSSRELPPKPLRAPPPPPTEELPPTPPASLPRPALKRSSASLSSMPSERETPSADYFPPVPSLPVNIPPSPTPPPFDAVLLSSVPVGISDPNKILVTLETSTTSYRTTFGTLTSRPSYLSQYLTSLLRPRRDSNASDGSELSYAEDSSFHSIFRNHLASTGLLNQAPPPTLHIFLDRPSAPYAHILSYLRSPLPTPEEPSILPRGAQLLSGSSSRLETLLELRDEACYLDLDELYKLCTDELQMRIACRSNSDLTLTHSRGPSSTSSLRSFRTMRERTGSDAAAHQRPALASLSQKTASSPSPQVPPAPTSIEPIPESPILPMPSRDPVELAKNGNHDLVEFVSSPLPPREVLESRKKMSRAVPPPLMGQTPASPRWI